MARHARLLFLLAAACGTGDPGQNQQNQQPDDADGAPQSQGCDGAAMRLGTGVRHFEEVANGGTVYLYKGPQGGYMLYISVQAKGLDPSGVDVCYEETFAGGNSFGHGCWNVRLTNDIGDGWFERIGIWGQIDADLWDHPQLVKDHDAHVAVTMKDTKGCSVSAAYDAHISPDRGM